MPLGMLYLGLRRSRGRIPPLGLAWSRHHIPSLDLAVMSHLLLSRSYAYGSRSTSFYLEGRGLVLVIAITVVSMWVRDSGVGLKRSCVGINTSVLHSTRQRWDRHVGIA
jgi:hypothetical protein